MMYLLDTNVISELRKAKSGKADQNVIKWASLRLSSELFISVINILEIEIGILSIERRDQKQGSNLRTWLNDQILPAFDNQILSIDIPVVQCCAALHVPDPCSERDALLAATAIVHGLIIVTRNLNDFKATGVQCINPWQQSC